ncbi:MAG: glucose-1-phosphate thymidylyltransferase [Muribaculaceae bacterium]|nr:glucose-1-phosphate thymidylyltransferase [Muribaculaceae bacterium]MDE5858661.1 glucose-1-phosphate thymidylyltransferase [Muribaculaceae bacterium]MDE7369247.1 glucose-1-phosphate thymidylyltransferase [Muribaculaceae bacterium]
MSSLNLNIVLFDEPHTKTDLLPLSYTRPIGDLRVGITTLSQKWESMLSGYYSTLTDDYLSEKFPANITDDTLFIASNILANEELAKRIASLQHGEVLVKDDKVIAVRGSREMFDNCELTANTQYAGEIDRVNFLYDIFLLNDKAIRNDFERMTAGRTSQPLSDTNTVIGDPSHIFLEEGATVEGAIINTKTGPIYIGRDAEIMEGCCLRGPVAICDGSKVNMGTRIYGATTIGPASKVGGELNNVVILGYSNKAHDGFLGNAVIGEWCNIGAGCVASNLKNDYTEIKLWNYNAHRFIRTGLQFCGLIMGDHSKAGINTMFNTATVLGVGVNVYGSGFQRNFLASFSEGSRAGFTDVPMSKFFEIAERVMARREKKLTETDKRIYEHINELAHNFKI